MTFKQKSFVLTDTEKKSFVKQTASIMGHVVAGSPKGYQVIKSSMTSKKELRFIIKKSFV